MHSFNGTLQSSSVHPASHTAVGRCTGFLYGKLLVAMPYIGDVRCYQSLIYVCSHDESGASGIIVNKILPGLTYEELIRQLGISCDRSRYISLHYGGPLDVSRGFVLHSTDYMNSSSFAVNEDYAITATLDILRHLSRDMGPEKYVLALGYMGWEAGQLEAEIQENLWLTAEADYSLVFNDNCDSSWRRAMSGMGVNPAGLSLHAGHA